LEKGRTRSEKRGLKLLKGGNEGTRYIKAPSIKRLCRGRGEVLASVGKEREGGGSWGRKEGAGNPIRQCNSPWKELLAMKLLGEGGDHVEGEV